LSRLPKNSSAPSATLWLLDGRNLDAEDLAFFAERIGASEARRLTRFARPERRRQFLLGRLLLRFAMARLTGVSADALRVLERSGQAPRLRFPNQRYLLPRFSLSHSREWVVCAASSAANLGVDIEVRDLNRDIDAIAEVVFDRYERHWLASLPDGQRLAGFYDLWCTKEALYKLRCNVHRRRHSLSLCQNDNTHVPRAWRWYQHVLSSSDLSVVLVSDRPCFEVKTIMLKGITRRQWLDPRTMLQVQRSWR
jgi:4'-phosphopantetheinyl transferase